MPALPPERRLWFPQGDPTLVREYHRPVFSRLLWRALCKARVPMTWMDRSVRRTALRNVQPGDLVYVWPPYDAAFIREVKNRGATVVAERINCMGSTCKVVLERAYARIGQPLPDGWCTPKAIADELTEMDLCDFICAPNDFVRRSLLEVGISGDRVLDTSYGWSPTRLAGAARQERLKSTPTFLFVGQGIVRKGLNLLLEAWERADITGTLLIAGRVHDEIRAVSGRQLARPDVQALGFIQDIASVYAAADVFLLPSHEEGGPQVTYEAAGCGLTSIVTPMAAGRIIRHEVEGYVIDPYDIEGWAAAIRRLARNDTLRRQMSDAARSRAKEFTWQKVALHLYDLLTNVMVQRPTSANLQAWSRP